MEMQACEQCGAAFSKLLPARSRHHCTYCGRSLCAACRNRFYPVPASILRHGNYALQPVCEACQAHLEGVRAGRRPLLAVCLSVFVYVYICAAVY
jgi:hypothetical protein